MPKLTSNTPLGEYTRQFDGLSLKEKSGFEIVSLAAPQSEEAAFAKTFKKAYGTTLPEPGSFAKIKSGKMLWTAQNQYFLFHDKEDDRLDETLASKFEGRAYATLQTDGWAAMEIAGSAVLDVLERFIPLDLQSAKTGFGTRTSAHQMSIIVLKTEDETYQLLTPTSSSAAFLEALEHVIAHVL